ncbi:DUF2332 domain-containing protein [Cellulomonas aerilata]|uniref:DUF2332 domain-containing protein n=1 Tax=Cellulomonas aerilata TaxID=515326 RepID=A0A512D7F7_9CELL|nr:DUF2332 domain-containing protein [Cellulomonas aerilata]GEO32418.1 hypothetical protein CAE01nite_01430 [Cellulomonas aerilata]
MDPLDAPTTTAAWYARFAEQDTRDASPVLSEWAAGIAGDDRVLALIDALPRPRRQPNLVLGAARYLGAPDGTWPDLRSWLLAHWEDVAEVTARRSTQTNEAGRCATLLPHLAAVDGPVALLEVGASAGLCLLPDRYSYRYDTVDGPVRLDPPDGPGPVVLPCRLDPPDDVPTRLPDVAWRAGIDLAPVDVTDPDDLAWLSALVWPGQDERLARLHAAARLVAADPPRIVRGDLVEALERTAAQAPSGARLVVLHTAVLAYLPEARRTEFVRRVRDLDATWISNESPGVLTYDGWTDPPAPQVGSRNVLAVDGVPRALTGQHGATWSALPTPPDRRA